MTALETFTAWRRSLDSLQPHCIPIVIGAPTSHAEALTVALCHCSRGDVLFVSADNALTGKSLVRIYTVQQGKKPMWHEGCTPNRPGPMIAKPVTEIACLAFDPVEPFNAMAPRADRVNGNDGHLRQVVEVRT